MRIGLVGTAYWAERVHGAAAAAHPDWELAGVWGRDPAKAAALAETLGSTAAPAYSDLLAGVDAVAFAVPPHVQAPLALEAARAGKHLLLEKPVALSVADAGELVAAVEESGVATVVFFTRLWLAESVQWLDGLAETGGWCSGRYAHIAALPESFLEGSPWRREHGALWDVGPHGLSTLERVLGRVVSAVAVPGERDHLQLLFTHAEGATSSADLSLTATPKAAHYDISFWGEAGRSVDEVILPSVDPPTVSAAALTSLFAQATTGERDARTDVAYGAHVVKVLAAAAESLASGRVVSV